MAAFLLVVLLAGIVSGSYVRYPRAAAGSSGAGAGAGAGSFSSASSSSFSSSSGTKVAPGPGGYGNFNAFSGMSNFGPSSPGDSQSLYKGGAGSYGGQSYGYGGQSSFPGFQGAGGFRGSQNAGFASSPGAGFPSSQGAGGFPGSQGAGFPSSQGGAFSGSQSTGFSGSQGAGFAGSGTGFPGAQGAGFSGSQGAGFPGFPGTSPFVPQYGQQYPWMPFPNFAAPFDFMSFLNQYFQALQNFQTQAQQAAASGGGSPVETNEVGGPGGVGGLATATYGPQGGYGSANIFPKPEGGLDNRFGGDDEAPQNSIGGGPVSSVSGSFKPPGGSSYGVFTSSSSGSSDINGKKTSFKQSSIGINDNGKVTTYTAHDP